MINAIARRVQLLVDSFFDGNQSATAKHVGIAQSTLHRILNGNIQSPTLETLRAIALSFGVEISTLLEVQPGGSTMKLTKPMQRLVDERWVLQAKLYRVDRQIAEYAVKARKRHGH